MILEIVGNLLNTLSLIRWADEAELIIKWIPEIAATLGIISLFIKRVRNFIFKILKYFYVKIPFMKRIAWLEEQMVAKNQVLTKLLEGQDIIKGELTQNGGKSLKDSVLNIELSVGKIRAGQKMLFDNTDWGIIELDENGMLLTVNEKVLDWSDRKTEELTGKGFYNIFHPDDREWVAKQVMAGIFDNRIFDIDARIMTNQTYYKYRIIGKPTPNNSKVTGYLVTLKKI